MSPVVSFDPPSALVPSLLRASMLPRNERLTLTVNLLTMAFKAVLLPYNPSRPCLWLSLASQRHRSFLAG